MIDPQQADVADADLWPWVKAADKLDAYLKCVVELAAGNREFAVARRQMEEPLRRSALPEVRYFLEHFAPASSARWTS